ncbi:MAG: hypothetical protein ACE5R6_10825 [Candidatus Heimdallarchaeota archaeon]
MQKEAIIGWMIVLVMLCSLVVISYYIQSHGGLSSQAASFTFPEINTLISKISTNSNWWCDHGKSNWEK